MCMRVCLVMCVCICACAYVWIPVSVCACRPAVKSCVLLSCSVPCVLRQSLSLNPNSLTGWAGAREPQGSPSLCLPSAGVTVGSHRMWLWALGPTQAPMLVKSSPKPRDAFLQDQYWQRRGHRSCHSPQFSENGWCRGKQRFAQVPA